MVDAGMVRSTCLCSYFVCWLPSSVMDRRHGDAMVKCSFIRILIFYAGLLTPRTLIFSLLMNARVSSPPCSTKSPKPILKAHRKSIQWASNMFGCEFGKWKLVSEEHHVVCDGVPAQTNFWVCDRLCIWHESLCVEKIQVLVFLCDVMCFVV